MILVARSVTWVGMWKCSFEDWDFEFVVFDVIRPGFVELVQWREGSSLLGVYRGIPG